MGRILYVAGAVAVLGALSGCGGGGTAEPTSAPTSSVPAPTHRPTPPSKLSGFLAIASNGALFIQWTRTADSVRGTISEAYQSQSDPTQAQSESHPFTGVISGSSITLTLDSGVNWNGSLNGSSGVTLSYTNDDGSLQSFDFAPASVADYNAAVANVQSSASGAQQTQAQQEAVAQTKQRIESYGSAVASDMEQLQSDVDRIQSDLGAMADAVTTAGNDTSLTYKEMQSVLAEAVKHPDGNYGSVCADAGTVSADAGTVEADEGSVEADGGSLDYDLSAVTDDIAKLGDDAQAFQTAHEALPGYRPSNPVDQGAVAQAITGARASMASARKTRAAHIAKAKSFVKTANDYAARAEAACNKVGG